MPAVTRVGDMDVSHCSGMTRAVGSPNTFANGKPVSRQGDINTGHMQTAAVCFGHTAPIAKGSSTVFVNGKGCGRVGDEVAGCTAVAEGSPNTFAGG